MKVTSCLLKHYLFIFSLLSLFNLNAQENNHDPALKQFDALMIEIKQNLSLNTLTSTERDQIYDIVGSLGICRPVIQTVLEQTPLQTATPTAVIPDQEHQEQTPNVSSETAPAPPISFINVILDHFDTLKYHLIQQLTENKIEAEHRESVYTLIGSINLCRPILKGADLLSEKMNAEMSKEQPSLTPAPEQPTTGPALDPSLPISDPSSSNTSNPVAS